jgi:hypothetical protein
LAIACALCYLADAIASVEPAVAAADAITVDKGNWEKLLVSGLPSLVEHRQSLWNLVFGGDEFVCVDFAVRSLGRPIPQLALTSGGVGGALFADLSAQELPCEKRGPGLSTLVISKVTDVEHRIRLLLPIKSFPVGEKDEIGEIIFLQQWGDPALSRSLHLAGVDYPTLQKAFLWFLGIATPALVTAGLGLFGFWLQKVIERSNAERQSLETLRREHAVELREFFKPTGLFQNTLTVERDSEYRTAMERELGNCGILSALPRKSLDRLMRALRGGDRKLSRKCWQKHFQITKTASWSAFGEE